jgi:hypothetical protein
LVPTTRTLSALHGAQPLAEALEAAQSTLGGGVVEPAAVAQAGGEAHHFAQPVEDDQLAVRVARDDHVKTVGAQDRRRRGRRERHDRRSSTRSTFLG